MLRFAVPASALALSMMNLPALAAVTADEVWSDLRALMESSGQSVSVGSESRSGNTLTVEDLVVSMELPEGSSSSSLDQIAFVERGDGTVEIVLSPEYRVISNTNVAEGESVEVQATMTHSALSLVVSGDASAKTYTYSAAALGVEISETAVAGKPLPFTARFDLNNPSGNYVSRSESGGHALDSTLVATAMRIALAGSDDAGGNFDFAMDFDDISGSSEAFLPEVDDPSDVAAMLRSGMAVAFQLRHGASDYSFKGDFEGSQSEGTGTAAGGDLDFVMNADEFSYGGAGREITFSMRSSDIPLPEIAATMEESAFRLTIPVSASDAPQDFGLLTAFRGLTISDSIWALFDPMANLPRDPVTVAVDVAGQARWLIDIFSPEAAAMDSPPGELSALTLKSLEVSAVGAELTGEGDFTFDNSDMVTFPGMPAPEGSVDLMLVGGNGLLDKVVAMGFLPEEEAMGFRMMLGLFARPGDGPDTLVSKIEVTADGQVLANGQRLR